MKKILIKYREIIVYGIVGVLNTVLNMAAYFLLESTFGVHYLVANLVAWILSFVFSFWANKVFVFQSTRWNRGIFLKELWSFFCGSVGTGVLDMLILYGMVSLMEMGESISKAIDTVLIIVINYFIRKFWVFKRRY